MKKRKFNLLLEIATLCLCVAAIAFGVYSAKTASLNVSGTIGFNAHNCNVIITPSYTCANSAEAGAIVKTTTLDSVELGNPSTQTSQNISFDSLFFNDLVENGDKIELTLQVENKSLFEVEITLGTLSYKNGENEISEEKVTKEVTITNKFIKDANQPTSDKTSTITIILTALDIDNATGIDGTVSLTISFEKGSQFYTEILSEKVYNNDTNTYETKEVSKLYTTMGNVTVDNTEYSLKWFAFAVQGIKQADNTYKKPDFVPDSSISITTGTGEVWYSLAGVNMASVDTKNYTFWFIQEKLISGIVSFFANADTYNNDDTDVHSNVYYYVNSTYESSLNLKNDDLYSKISERKVDEKYSCSSGESVICKFESRFWILNISELSLLINKNIVLLSKSSDSTDGLLYQGEMPNVDCIGSVAPKAYFLRDMKSSDWNYNNISSIDMGETCGVFMFTGEDPASIRTAFQITL